MYPIFVITDDSFLTYTKLAPNIEISSICIHHCFQNAEKHGVRLLDHPNSTLIARFTLRSISTVDRLQQPQIFFRWLFCHCLLSNQQQIHEQPLFPPTWITSSREEILAVRVLSCTRYPINTPCFFSCIPREPNREGHSVVAGLHHDLITAATSRAPPHASPKHFFRASHTETRLASATTISDMQP